MSLNRFMHPRNPYKNPPDFNKLVSEFPELSEVADISLSGRTKLDFSSENTVRILTKCLLKRDFDLDVELPPEKLAPTLPLRLNYLLWIEDILDTFGLKSDIRGFDIGCGASCVYPLLAARKFRWKMRGSDVDESSLETAKENVRRNNLESAVELHLQEPDEPLFQHAESCDFSMCNPPFFGSSDEVEFKNRTGNRDPPSGVTKASPSEIVVDGGEVQFVSRMIDESLELRDKIKVFTSMLGKRSSLTKIKALLQEKKVTNFISTEFCQGRTTRWGVAWSFASGLFLNKAPQFVRAAGYRKAGHCVSFTFSQDDDFDRLEEALEAIFSDLRLTVSLREREPNAVIWEMSAVENSWSHQRRKRRKDRQPNSEPEEKRPKIEENFLKFSARLVYQDPSVVLELGFLEGSAGKDAVNQILQYVKNTLNKKSI